jgi:hypothetical protein
MCAVCGKPVDRMEMFDDPLAWRRVYTAYCHGETEETVISRELMEDAISISAGVAFSQKRITDGR